MDSDRLFTLRPGTPQERGARMRLIEQAWRVAYAHIYTRQEIDGVFDGTIPSFGGWAVQRKRQLGTINAITDANNGDANSHTNSDANGTIIGFISLAELLSGDGEVTALYVLPEYQQRGVGTALWQAGCDRLRQHGCAVIWVWTLARASSVRFYERQGAVRADEGIYEVGSHHEQALGFRLETGKK